MALAFPEHFHRAFNGLPAHQALKQGGHWSETSAFSLCVAQVLICSWHTFLLKSGRPLS